MSLPSGPGVRKDYLYKLAQLMSLVTRQKKHAISGSIDASGHQNGVQNFLDPADLCLATKVNDRSPQEVAL